MDIPSAFSAKFSVVSYQPGLNFSCKYPAVPVSSTEWLLFLAEGTMPETDFWSKLADGISSRPGAAGFECRVLPYDTAHYYHPSTLQTPVICGDAVVVRRDCFESVGGFEHTLPTAWAFIDISRRLSGAGHTLYYLPAACTAAASTAKKNLLSDYLDSHYSKLMLGYKYGGIAKANIEYLRTMKHPQHFPSVRKQLLKKYATHFLRLWPLLFWRLRQRGIFSAHPALFWEAIALQRGCEPLQHRIAQGPCISVVVRTHRRPDALRRALQSVENQTYPPYEVIVVEDGDPTAMQVCQTEFSHLPLRYLPTLAPVGRSRAGNIGMENATGEYICFLDDDDMFFPEHLELLAAKATAHPDVDMVLGTALVCFDRNGADCGFQMMHFDRLDIFTMSQQCQIPIESVLFKKSLFLRCGGLDEKLSAHEDWSMWLRFLSAAKRIHPSQVDIHRATCVFVQTADEAKAAKRLNEYSANDDLLFNDESIRFNLSLRDLRMFYSGMLGDIRHLEQLGKLEAFLSEHESKNNT